MSRSLTHEEITHPLHSRPPIAHGWGRRAPHTVNVTLSVDITGEARSATTREFIAEVTRLADRLGAGDVRVAASPAVRGVEASPASGCWGIQVVPGQRRVIREGHDVELTRLEFDLLAYLAGRPRRVFSRSHLLREVWGYGQDGGRTVDVHIRRLRAKLGADIVVTVRGVGYRLAESCDIRVLDAAPAVAQP